MSNLFRSPGRQGYAALALFLIVYVAAMGLVLAPDALLSGPGTETAVEG